MVLRRGLEGSDHLPMSVPRSQIQIAWPSQQGPNNYKSYGSIYPVKPEYPIPQIYLHLILVLNMSHGKKTTLSKDSIGSLLKATIV